MKVPIIGGAMFLLSGAAALAAVALMSPLVGDEEPTTVVFSVPDMHCEFACAPMVRETLGTLPGVAKVETDVEKQTATVVTGDGFAADQALAALEAAGFPAKTLTQ